MSYMHLKFSFLEIKLLFCHPPYICSFVQCFLCWLVTSPLWPFPHFLHPVSIFCPFHFLTGSKAWFHPHPHCCCLCLELNTFPPLAVATESSCVLLLLSSLASDLPRGNYTKLAMSLCSSTPFTSPHRPQFLGTSPDFIMRWSPAYPNSFHTSFPWCFSSFNIKLC